MAMVILAQATFSGVPIGEPKFCDDCVEAQDYLDKVVALWEMEHPGGPGGMEKPCRSLTDMTEAEALNYIMSRMKR